MFKYDNVANIIISVDIYGENNNYSVIAMAKWDNKDKLYYVSFYLKGQDTDMLDLIDGFSNVRFDSDTRTIKTDMAKYITSMSMNEKLLPYIERYEYYQKCFTKGNDYYEREGLLLNA